MVRYFTVYIIVMFCIFFSVAKVKSDEVQIQECSFLLGLLVLVLLSITLESTSTLSEGLSSMSLIYVWMYFYCWEWMDSLDI